LTERDCCALKRTVSKNHRTTAAQVTSEMNVHLEDLVSTKTVQHELHKSNIHGRAATTKPLITESNAQMRERWCHNHKTWTSDNWKPTCDTVESVVLHTVSYIRKSLHLENTQGRLQSRMPGLVPTVKHGGGFLMVWAAILWYPVGPIFTLHGRITARKYVDRLGNQAHPMIQMLFPNNDAVFQEDNAPILTSETFSVMV
jgi:hypothetical protein